MTVITRFAPSPTGYLHIGSARTALFNYLFTKHHGGQFYLRIEDTDRERSTQQAVDAIFESLQWLGLQWDGDPIYQFQRADRHAQVARALVEQGRAYYCFCSVEELNQMREEAQSKGLPPRYNGYWRDKSPSKGPSDRKPVIRLKAPLDGETVIQDEVQGVVHVQNSQLDDMILLRADGTPTYMLSVVVDDHDMGITHVIRGDDHLNNAFRQYHLYKACDWDVPVFAHIPLIHGPDGAKLSKRHGAVGAEGYKAMGILPIAMRNYLLRLGWAHGDAEIISDQEAIDWFDLKGIGRSPSRFDVVKLHHLNAHYMREIPDDILFQTVQPFLSEKAICAIDDQKKQWIMKGMGGLKIRAKSLIELAENMLVYIDLPPLDQDGLHILNADAKILLKTFHDHVHHLTDWTEQGIETALRDFATRQNLKFGELAKILRIALTHKTVSPSLFEIMSIVGLDETLQRISDAASFV